MLVPAPSAAFLGNLKTSRLENLNIIEIKFAIAEQKLLHKRDFTCRNNIQKILIVYVIIEKSSLSVA